jgi:hypothetical protein
MRSVSILHPTDNLPAPPDTIQTLLIAGSSGQAMDWISSGSTALGSASSGGPQLIRISAQTTAGQSMNCMVNLFSTAAAAPSSGSFVATTAASSGVSFPVMGQGTFQVPGNSTGWSVASLTSGYIITEQWRK